ncbi:MAG: rubrerythrin [Bacteroidetes bacterium HGW-Bacteroidetes-17]|jgi:rubrerythrin|nr:MAG: rubrerythrin [Bacteroidetes bacterium HGW-Bacteroidetes-17]
MEEFKSINEILEFAIASEQDAVEFYSNLADQSKNTEMKAVFQQFAKEEMNHKSRLIKIQDEGSFELKSEKIHDLKIADYLVDVQVSPKMSYQDALVVAMKKEKAAFKLYTNLAAKAPNESLKNIFLSLAQEESKHKLRFEIEYDDYILKEN